MTEEIVLRVKERYAAAATGVGPGCCNPADAGLQAKALGYDEADLAAPGNLGLGCGNPLALAALAPGMTVLDLGSGGGFDAFLAAGRVGAAGRVIGVDMTPEMLALARANAARLGAANVEFREGRIEALPLDDASVDVVISNCVINLSVDKPAVFREAFRVLRPGGVLHVSDLVLALPLPDAVKTSVEAYVGCVAGASPIGDYLAHLFGAGFAEVALPTITSAPAPPGVPPHALVSATFRARKAAG